jgi:hypothetical protein
MSHGHPHIPPPLFDHDAKALDAHAAQNHRNALGLNEDLGHVGGWIWSAVRWPFRLLHRIVRG